MDFAQIINELMVKNNYSNNKIYNLTGISDTTIKAYRDGTREPNLKNLNKLADLFSVTTDYLSGRDEPQKAPAVEAEDKELLEIIDKIKKLNEKGRKNITENLDNMLCNPANLIAAQRVKKRA